MKPTETQTRILQRMRLRRIGLGFRKIANKWSSWAIENLAGKHLRRAVDISIAMCDFGDVWAEQEKTKGGEG